MVKDISVAIKRPRDKLKRKCLYRNINNDRNGVSNVVTSIMMLGILLSIMAMILTVYVPNWAKSGEAKHMSQVLDTFLDLKSTLDNQIGEEQGVGDIKSTRIKLNAEGGSVLGVGRTTGTISFEPEEFNIEIYNTEEPTNIYGQASGLLMFESSNTYFSNQDLIYESGSVIIDQDGNAIMRAKPSFDVTYNDNKTSLSIMLIQLTGDTDGRIGTGYYSIESKLIESVGQSHELIWSVEQGFTYGQNITINITSRYGPMWEGLIEEELSKKLPVSIKETKTDIDVIKYKDPLTADTYYHVVVTIHEVYKLDCKKGTVEINIT